MQSCLRLLISALFLTLVLACSPPPESEFHLSGPTMGTTYNVKFINSADIKPADLQEKIDVVLVEVNQLMSTYIKDSELSRFNQWHSTDVFELSPQTLLVMQEAKRLGELSEGLLDVTVGPLVNLWGFGPQARPEKVPTQEQVDAAKAHIGLDKLTLGESWAQKTDPMLYVDLSTIAKGYGVDRVAQVLEEQHITNYLVEIGGEMRLSGQKASGKDWRVAIEKPVTTERAVERIISVGNNAVATSGDYRIYFENDGKRYSHLINPETGSPITHNLVSVTVVHPSSMTADGLATALSIMGKDKALAVAELNQLAVLLITKEADSFKEYTSSQFSQIVTIH
ncbi:FAD:protein FMN transferase [Paraglaciecola hydrolytica]|uniref:FAD:protein FMN transferase n=1 Tax=Paraglaciecola hydrolytica TaxID=1799789 RepID=A0A136A4Y9_9ALTE|nr:FAD:protein FMN transferase [Paraglaciecola hydrolytica]KXI30287.1 thiamine biosynthesis lipoprotein [Paraglaciecola hydrolytica]